MPTSATQGFAVLEKIPVASGIVDAVASRERERVVIEVTGEDSGGYGSAQMNLQMVVGQISSRMDDFSATNAIAFPMTANPQGLWLHPAPGGRRVR
jgi:hypothetical protein